MRYMMLFTETPKERARRTDPAEAPAYWGAWRDYVAAIEGAGIVVSGAGLEPPETATTVRVVGGAHEIQDGPFADLKDQIGGFFVIEVADLDAAIGWAARSPAAQAGAVEIRPVMAPPSAE